MLDLFLWKRQISSAGFLTGMFVYIINNIKMLYYDKTDVSEGTDDKCIKRMWNLPLLVFPG